MTSSAAMQTKLFYLHLPKCAGMSVMRALVDNLPSSQVYQSTSMLMNFRENLTEFAYFENPKKLRAMVGHWLHEEMLKVVKGNFLFCTSLRDPVERIKSQFRFDVRRSQNLNFQLDTPQDFLKKNANTLCNFVNRAFPSIASDYENPAEAAITVLSGFDVVYEMEQTDQVLPYLFGTLGLSPPEKPVRINTTDDVEENIGVDDDLIREHLEHDLQLYEHFRKAREAKKEAMNPLRNDGIAARLNSISSEPLKPFLLFQFLSEKYAEEMMFSNEVRQVLDRLKYQRIFINNAEKKILERLGEDVE